MDKNSERLQKIEERIERRENMLRGLELMYRPPGALEHCNVTVYLDEVESRLKLLESRHGNINS